MVQWLGLCISTAGGMGSIPGQGTKIPQAVQHEQNIYVCVCMCVCVCVCVCVCIYIYVYIYMEYGLTEMLFCFLLSPFSYYNCV